MSWLYKRDDSRKIAETENFSIDAKTTRRMMPRAGDDIVRQCIHILADSGNRNGSAAGSCQRGSGNIQHGVSIPF